MSLTKGHGGEADFILDEGDIPLKAMFTALARTIDLPLPEKSAPGWLLKGIARAAETIWRRFNLAGAPPITRHVVMVMTCDCVFDGSKARRELDHFPSVSREAGLSALTAAMALTPA